MSKICPISGFKTNCTDNCASCQAEEKKYVARAYLEKSMRGLMDSIKTDSLDEISEFINSNCEKGLYCEVCDRASGQCTCICPDFFVEEDEFIKDLQLEQTEQM